MTASRSQHIIPAACVLVLAIVVTWLSFTEQPADAYLFPRVISVAFIALAIWNFARAAAGLARVGGGLKMTEIRNIVPGLIVAVVYVFWVARGFGFYLGSTVAFLVVFSIYDPASHTRAATWMRRVIITAGFIAVMYGLFALLLQVQTPRGLFL